MSRTTLEKINRASERRAANWAGETDPSITKDLTGRLEDLYAELRLERARDAYGDRPRIMKRARVERELERISQV